MLETMGHQSRKAKLESNKQKRREKAAARKSQ